jgi:hypothetical protein
MNAKLVGILTLAGRVDHTRLKPDAPVEQGRKLQIAWPMLEARESRIDASASISILKEAQTA